MVSFHPSLGIPLIITGGNKATPAGGGEGFHPSLGIPLIITLYSQILKEGV
jgi:hypothetical protein